MSDPKEPEDPKIDATKRHGPLTGARIVLLVLQQPRTATALSQLLGMDASYVREVCRDMAENHILRSEVVAIPGKRARPCKLYSIHETFRTQLDDTLSSEE